MKKILTTMIAMLAFAGLQAQAPKGVDRANIDPSVSPGENFYRYACGGWMKAHPLDPQYARFGTFDQLGENSREQVKEIITGLGSNNPRGSIEQKVADLYALGMDADRRNAEGAKPVAALLENVYKAKLTPDELARQIGMMHKGYDNVFFVPQIMADMKNSNVNMLYFSQDGLTLPDRDYYLDTDNNAKRIRTALEQYIIKVMTLAGRSKGQAKKAAKNVIAIETRLAQVAMTREQTRDMAALYNVFTLAQIKADYPNINWNVYLNQMGITPKDDMRICVCQPKSIALVNQMMTDIKTDAMRDYLAFHIVNSAAPYLSDDFVNAHFDLFSRALSGKQQIQPLWKRSLDVPNTLLGEAVGQLYVAKYFPAESKKKMQRLVDNLKVALGEHIASLPWMGMKTKVNALVKLNSFTVKIGYPDRWHDYSSLDINPAKSYFDNVMAARVHAAEYEIAQLDKPVDKDRWWMSPQTVNAYYEPSSNEICFPAAILQPPYFDPNADDASNYGAIGVVIGHEMTHGFDDQGRNFDHMGNMVDWWTEEDAAKFKALADRLGAQYSAEIVADDVHANGNFTMGENIADHGGLRVAYTALKHTDQGKANQPIDGFTPDQRFFLSYANVWAANITKEEILRRTKVDPHSLGINRVNVAIRNLEPFFKAFNIKPGDKMWRDPADRVAIW